jgi:hypothetical protein
MLKSSADATGMHEETSELRVPLVWLELGVGLVLLIAAAYYMRGAFALPQPMNPNSLGAGSFPVIIASGLAVGVLTLLIFSVVKIVKKSKTEMVDVRRPMAVVAAMLVLLGHAWLLETLGAAASTAAFGAMLMIAAGERRPIQLIAIPLALALGIYLVFSVALGVPFP